MKYYLLLFLLMVTILVGLFLLAQALDLPLLTDPGPWLSRGGVAGALLGVSLLIADVAIPVPASIVMVAHGAAFGVLVGTSLSLVGSLGAGWLGFLLGRRAGPLLDRLVPPPERARAEGMLRRWGALAIVVTRPVPILAESLAILAGTSSMTWTELTAATVAGSVPAAFLYAVTGAAAWHLVNSFFWVLLAVPLVAAPAWLLSRRLAHR